MVSVFSRPIYQLLHFSQTCALTKEMGHLGEVTKQTQSDMFASTLFILIQHNRNFLLLQGHVYDLIFGSIEKGQKGAKFG